MKKFLSILIPLCLIGCATPPPPKLTTGDLVQFNAPKSVYKDAVNAISEIYPPAKNQLTLSHSVRESDLFGQSLVKELRAAGFAVKEFTPDEKGDFFYIVDSVQGTAYTRLIIKVKGEQFSRAYIKGVNGYAPASAWTRGK